MNTRDTLPDGEPEAFSSQADTVPDAQPLPTPSGEHDRILAWMSSRVPQRFELRKVLGEGSMGQVFLAFDRVREAEVALKVLRNELVGDAQIEQRFRREASVLQALSHPGVVKVDFVHRASPLCFSMDYLSGETLLDAIRSGRHRTRERGAGAPAQNGGIGGKGPSPLSVNTVRTVAREVLDALVAVHEQGVVHGDLKPENIFLRDPDGACLVDFGLAKMEGLTRLTRTGKFAGTLMYTAPELLTGLAQPSHRIDLYSLGQCLFFALSGQHPFAVEKHPGAQMLHIARGKRALDFPSHVTSDLRDFVDRLSATRPEERFTDAASARTALAELR